MLKPGIIGYSVATGGYDSDAQAYFTAAGITDTAQKDAYNTFVLAAKANSYYTKFTTLYPFIGGTSGSHAVNAITPGTYDLTFTGSPTHSSGGVAFSSSYADTGLQAYGNLGENSNHMSLYSTVNSTNSIAAVSMGAYDGSFTGMSIRRSNDIAFYHDGTDGANYTPWSNSDARGFFHGVRESSTDLWHYVNGTAITHFTNAKTGVCPADNIRIGTINISGNFATCADVKTIAFCSIGSGMTSTDASNFYTDVQTLQTALSRQV